MFGEDDNSDFSTSDLIASLADNATQAYETTQALNANPLNTALIYGGSAQTQYGSTVSATPSTVGAGSSGLLLLVLAVGVVIFAATR